MPPVSEATTVCPVQIGQRLEVGYDPSSPHARSADTTVWLASRLEDRDDAATRLTLAWPTDAQRRLILVEPGDAVAVAASSPEDALYAADAVVDATSHQPLPLLVVRVSSPWRRSQRRQAVRVAVAIRPRLAARLDSSASKTLRLGITNLSASGLQVRSQDELHAGDLLAFAFELIGIPQEVELQARVRRVYRFERGGSQATWDAGGEFEGLPERLGQRIVQYIFAQQRALARATRGHL
jgi:c-di-GMP-binding flagellar brake protein YcgR